MPSSKTPTAAIVCLAFLLSSGRSGAFDEIKYRGYLPSFPAPAPASGVGQGGSPGVWLGGDAGFTCPLDESRSFWSFCDVAIGLPGARTRKDSSNFKRNLAVGNSIGIATCHNGRFEMRHFFRGSSDHPLPFFLDPNNPESHPRGSRLWIRQSILHNGRLYIFASQIFDPGNPYNTFIIRVANPMDSPHAWKYEYIALGMNPPPKLGQQPPADPAAAYFGNDLFLDGPGNFLYVYGVHPTFRDRIFRTFDVIALRIPLDKLESAPAGSDLGVASQFLSSREGVWRPGLFDPTDFHKVGIPAFNGFSVRYNSSLKAWQTVFGHDRALMEFIPGNRRYEDPLVNTVYTMTSKTPFGPWSAPKPVAMYPEMDPKHVNLLDRPHGPDCYGYFVREYPSFETWDGDIVFGYSIGSLAESRHHNSEPKNNDMKLYDVYAWPAAHPFFGPKMEATSSR